MSHVESVPARKQLRYAVLIDSENLAAWQYNVLDNLVGSGDARLVALILPERDAEPPRFSLREFFRNFMYFVARMTFWKPKFFRHSPLPGRWASLPRLKVKVERKGKFSDYIAKPDLEKLKELDLDFILKFGLRILRGGALT